MENNTNNKAVDGEALKNNAAIFAIVVGAISIIGGIVLPLLALAMANGTGRSFGDIMSDPMVIMSMVVGILLGAAFLVLGIMFKKNGSKTLAIVLIVLLAIYAIERISAIFLGTFLAIIWAAFAIYAIVCLIKYIQIQNQPQPTEITTTNSSPDEMGGTNADDENKF